MKKIITLLLSCALLCGVALSFTSCGRITIEAGKYVSEGGEELEVIYEQIMMSEDIEDEDGKLVLVYDYFIEDGKITLTVDRVEVLGEGLEDYLEAMQEYYKNGRPRTFEFEKVEGGFKMGGATFKKV